ncbi:hypothetical protein EC973_005406 [Apophysomyces ossiformis]|uniref:Uncharacterized protein n=1 Tax=Apophysomyces ossiformis TaxID=679940 RepID=A0A8H7EK55_9FUNG|nr:hypothetical protein EC973_005406 [Apophysomyces ossiformis]
MPHKRAKSSIRAARKKALGSNLPVTKAESDDTPKGFARLLRFKEMVEKRRTEKKAKKEEEKNQKTGLTIQPGERVKDFNARVEQEYKKEFIDAVRAAKPVSQRKLKNREARKQKKVAKKEKMEQLYGGRDFDDLKDQVSFGEVADAPPTLTKVPKARGRGKEELDKKTKEVTDNKYESDEDENMKLLKASHKRKLQNMSASARKALDDERTRVIEHYRAKKAKKMAESGLTPLT